jgi:hypothetical protein
MAKNLMCPAHKVTNKAYRDKYDKIFKKDKKKTTTPAVSTKGRGAV